MIYKLDQKCINKSINYIIFEKAAKLLKIHTFVFY
jgi:hypothetical protein